MVSYLRFLNDLKFQWLRNGDYKKQKYKNINPLMPRGNKKVTHT